MYFRSQRLWLSIVLCASACGGNLPVRAEMASPVTSGGYMSLRRESRLFPEVQERVASASVQNCLSLLIRTPILRQSEETIVCELSLEETAVESSTEGIFLENSGPREPLVSFDSPGKKSLEQLSLGVSL